ncbi:MAG: 30S ribosomal protein S5 [bacterium]
MLQNNNEKKKNNPRSSDKSEKRDEFDQKIVDLARVTRVMAGGKRMKFRACIVIGDHKGKVGFGIAKGEDVSIAINKATNKARKKIIKIKTKNDTIPFEIRKKFKAAKIMIKPAPKGTGIKAGGAVRIILELSGIQNVVGKILGTNNKINNVQATMLALSTLTDFHEQKAALGRDMDEK